MGKSSRIALLSLTTGALMMSSLAQAQEKISALKPQSSWSVKPMASNADNAYCALSRQYDQNLVLTLGQSVNQEYSLVMDFTNGSLNPDKAYDITLQPAPGQIRAYEMMPASARALVVRLGYDDSFLNALSDSGLLKAEVDGKSYHFDVKSFAGAHEKLKNCMAGLGGTRSSVQVAETKFQAKKQVRETEDVAPMPKAPAAKVETPKIEMKKLDRAPVVVKAVDDAPQQAVSIAPPEIPVINSVTQTPDVSVQKPRPPSISMSKLSSEVVDKTVEVAQNDGREEAKRLMEEQRQAAQKAKEAENAKRQEAEALAAQKAAEIERKAQELAQKQEAQKREEEERRLAEAKAKAETERLEQLRLEKERVARAKLEAQKVEQERLANLAREQEQKKRAEEQVKISKAERITEAPRAPVAIRDNKPVDMPEVVASSESLKIREELDVLKAENEKLASALSVQENKLASLDKTDPKAQSEIEEIKVRMQELEQENRALYLEARKARGAIDTAVVNTGNKALGKIKEYERKLVAAQADNQKLLEEIEELRRIKEDGRLDVVAGDWDLEKSTQRYNEAEREIKRLGLLLEQQRTAHRQEKIELEQMLFDPAVTDKEQRRKLAELELKLAAAQKQLASAGRSIPSVRSPSVTRYGGSERVDVSSMQAVPAPKVEQTIPRAPVTSMPETSFPRIEDTPTSISAVPAPIQPRLAVRAPVIRDEIPPVPDVVSTPVQKKSTVAAVEINPDVVPTPRAVLPPVSRSAVSRSMDSAKPLLSKTTQVLDRPVVSTPLPVKSFSRDGLIQLLQRSGVAVSGNVNQRGPGQYQWKAGKLSGQAQIVPMAQVGSVDQFVSRFMTLSKKACAGDFASLPAPDVAKGRAFEIACITPKQNIASSVIFAQRGSDVVMIGHEISADDMDLAMDARDRIARKL